MRRAVWGLVPPIAGALALGTDGTNPVCAPA